MRDREPTIRSRELGDGLRLAMERAGLTGRQVAKRLGWSDSRVSRLLSGKRGATENDVASFLGVCGVIGDERLRLLKITRELGVRTWIQQFGAHLPVQIRTLVELENKATVITQFAALMLPGLLQTDAYTRALLTRNANVPAAEIEERVAARAARRIIFSREHPPNCTFLIHEFALRLRAGTPEVMSDQLHTLLRVAVRSNITIRVVPAAFGIHAGMAGTFTVLESTEYKPVVYLEEETIGAFLEKPEEIAAYKNVARALSAAALDEGESKELIAGVAIDLYSDREGGHALE